MHFIILCLLILFPVRSQAERGDVIRVIKSPSMTPSGLAYDGKRLWVSDHRDAKIYMIDLSTGNILKVIQAPSFEPVGLAFDGSNLWCVDGREKMAFRINLKTFETDHRVELEASQPRGLAWYKEHLVVSDDGKGLIHEVDPEDGTTIRTIPAPSKGITGVGFTQDIVWVANRLDDAIYAVDWNTGEVYFDFPSPGQYPFGLTIVSDQVAVVDYQKDEIAFISITPKKAYRVYGEKRLNLEYKVTLQNYGPDKVSLAEILVALPDERVNQEILDKIAFEPIEPSEVLTDEDGQRVARFIFKDIQPQGVSYVIMNAKVKLHNVRFMVLPQEVGGTKEIPKDIANVYVRDGSKLLLSDPKIKERAGMLARESKDVFTLVRKTYDFVINHMSYELSGGWNPSPMILERGTGSCSEYSILLIALLRANGIPARYVGSVVVRGDDASFDDVFHRWVEVYLPKIGWFPLDANRGDKPTPKERGMGFGYIDDKVMITTQSAGGGILGWQYNSRTRYTCEGRCKVIESTMAEWSPLSKDEK